MELVWEEQSMGTKFKEITIGCDPEFVILIPPYSNHSCILPAIEIGGGRHSPFGGDGELFEIRPGYSHNTLDIISSMKDLLEKGNSYIKIGNEAKWRCGHCCFGSPMGGHIHIGNLPTNYYYDRDELVNDLKVTLIDGVSNLIDPIKQRASRRATGYGRALDFRTEDGGRRIEYRAPGSFLISPKITFLNLIVAKITAMLFLTRDEYFPSPIRKGKESKPKRILKEVLNELVTNPIFNKEPDKELGIKVLEESIENKKPMNWDEDFRNNWGIK